MKIQFRVSALLAILSVVGASLVWQSAILTETNDQIAITGFAAYPQFGLVLGIQLILLFGVRYWRKVPAFIATLIGLALSVLALTPTLSAAISGNFHLLRAQLTIATGISDWEAQLGTIHNLETNYSVAITTITVLMLLCLWSLRAPFIRRALKPADSQTW